jgi:hypothetical protein
MTEPVAGCVGTPNPEAAEMLWEAVLEWKLRTLSTTKDTMQHEGIEFETKEVPVSAVRS